MPDTPLSNHLTVTATQAGDSTIIVRSDGTPEGTNIKLSDETKLGLVQTLSWSIDVSNRASCTVTSMATPAEMKALARHTEVRIIPAPGYHPLRYLWDWYVAKWSRFIPLFHKVPVI